MEKSIGVPSMQGMKSSFGDFAIGAIGGLAYALSQSIFGSGLIGAVVSAVLAGSIVKGQRGTALSTVAGFMLMSNIGGGGASASSESSEPAVM